MVQATYKNVVVLDSVRRKRPPEPGLNAASEVICANGAFRDKTERKAHDTSRMRITRLGRRSDLA